MQEQILFSLPLSEFERIQRRWIRDEVASLFQAQELKGQPTPTDPTDRFLTVEEASKMLGISPSTIRNYRKAGSLKPVRFGRAVRYRYADLVELAGQNVANR